MRSDLKFSQTFNSNSIFKKYYWEKDKFGILNFKKSIKYAFISGYKRCIEELILGEEDGK